MRRKILFISSWYPSRLEPTNGNFVQRHAESVALFHDVEALHAVGDFNLNKKFEVTESVVNGIRTVIIYYKNSKNPVKNFLNRMKAYRFGFKKMTFPDLVHANILHNSMLFAVYLKRELGIPYVVSEHWSGFLEINRPKLSLLKLKTAKIIAKNAEIILPVSKSLGENLQDLGILTRQEIIPNVVDTSLFTLKKKQNLEFTFLHISNLVPLKNPEKIIEAVIHLRNKGLKISLEIGGDGEVLPLKNLVRKHSAESYSTVFGEISHCEVARKMQNSDCFVLFSDYENLPCVLLESMSCGVPVISTNVGGVSEVVDEKSGILIEKNFEELVEAMEKIAVKKTEMHSPEGLHDIISAKFSKEKVGAQFSEIYARVLQK